METTFLDYTITVIPTENGHVDVMTNENGLVLLDSDGCSVLFRQTEKGLAIYSRRYPSPTFSFSGKHITVAYQPLFF